MVHEEPVQHYKNRIKVLQWWPVTPNQSQLGLLHMVVGYRRRLPALEVSGALWAVHEQRARGAQRQQHLLILSPEVLVQQPVHHCVQAAVEVRHEIAGHEQPLWNFRGNPDRVNGHSQADEVQGRPADGEQHEDHEHGEEVAQVAGAAPPWVLRLHAALHPDDQHPDAQVAVGHHGQWHQEVHHHHADGVGRAGRLREGAGVDARVVAQRAHQEVGHGSQAGEHPGEQQVQAGFAAGVEPVVVQAMADVAVAVERDGHDVEDRADDAQAHDKAAQLAVQWAHGPAIVEDSQQCQRVGIQRHHQVCHWQAHHKDVSYKRSHIHQNKMNLYYRHLIHGTTSNINTV